MGDQRKAGPHDMRSAYPVMRRVIHTVLVAWMVMKGTLVPKHNVGVRDIRGARHVGRQIPRCELHAIIRRHPEIILRERLV
jgi:hypothetical protein